MPTIIFPNPPAEDSRAIRSLQQSFAHSDSIRSLFGKSDPTSLNVSDSHRTFDLLLNGNGQLRQDPTPSGVGYLLRNDANEIIAAVYLDQNGGFRSLEFASVFTQLPQHAKEGAALSKADRLEVAVLHVPELQLTAALLLAPHDGPLVWPLTTNDAFTRKLYTMSEFRRIAEKSIQQRTRYSALTKHHKPKGPKR